MESLVNERVRHLKFGEGSIVEEPREHIKVRFQENDTVKSFMFPEAFDGFLKFEDGGLQEQYRTLAVTRRQQKEKERMAVIVEKEQERRQQQLETLGHRKTAASHKARPAVKRKESIQEGQQ